VKLRNHAFNFGTAVPGSNLAGVNTYLAAHPTPGSTAANFQQRLNAHFNSIVPENAGKWSNNEASRGAVTMANVDRILSYAETNNMRVRMHNLIWGNQQPAWVNSLLSSAAAGNSADAASLRSAISDRINYYIRQRAHRYAEIDIYNESVHTPQYWNVYGASGVAGVYNESAAAIAAAGGSAKAFTNEYNVVQDSADYYANWYRRHVQEIRDAGGSVGGIGLQYYSANATGSFNNQHSPARIFAAMHNLAVEDLPLALTEFGVKSGGSGTTATQQNRAAQILEETMRLVFGMPSTTGFTMWGFWQDAVWSGAPEGVLYNSDWSIRPAGERFTALMNEWSTELTLPVAADGTINFTGFFGDYDITIAGETYALSLKKGQTSYTLFVPEPGSLALLMVWATLLSRRCRSLAR
jgi:endo-1,4-beta-xylanase